MQGLDASTGGIQLVSHQIETILGVEVSVLMGANLAEDVAQEQFCEATVGEFRRQHLKFVARTCTHNTNSKGLLNQLHRRLPLLAYVWYRT